MKAEQLQQTLNRLEELYEKRLLAKRIVNPQKCSEATSSVDKDIDNYAAFMPYELKEIFYKQVGANALNCQHADDISQCIDIVRGLLKEKTTSE